MTREEAVERLNAIKQFIGYDKDSEIVEATQKSIDMAIKALEQEPCDNAISRQAVLEMEYDMSEIDGEHFTEPCMVVDVEDIQKLPPVNPQEPKWIPVSERLPKKESRYLTTILNEYDNELRYIMTCDYFSNGCWCPDDECASSNVIAWMPLPEPYKAESEIHCNCTDAEIAKSFIEDVEAVKDLLPQESEGKG